ncbi:carbon-nitrogen hydrolase family protein [Tengunoibacter tsumagoiensis]|uniref:CN hydrolase domain-containing protein n=1 Tax=Tengunoibacter tsumagoiensis TaxID=2014871 RepID=A0A402A8N1_9CHLR|nr:carbon-nitrogen hydrolase family protein [Tengunoibacter tsumagoiensis]GCE15345.1 hypothetical protein KTT_52040 [Tengunoibacter tsumagoiensis]
MQKPSVEPLKVGIGQIPIVMGNKHENIQTITNIIISAGQQHCDLIILPECSLTGWLSEAARRDAEPVPGPFSDTLGHLARQYHMAIVVGLEEREGQNIYNTALLIDRQGNIVNKHRKINELDIALQLYTRGEALKVVDFEGRKVALDICADSWTPHLTESLYLMGAQIIFSPCAWACEPGQEAKNAAWISQQYQARTAAKALYIVSANSIGAVTEGVWQGRILHGESQVFGPDGEKMLHGPVNEAGLLFVHLPA